MEHSVISNYRYQLCAQNFPRGAKCCVLVIKDWQSKQNILIGARRVLQDGEFLLQLDPDHVQQIANIHAMELAEDEIRRLKQAKSAEVGN